MTRQRFLPLGLMFVGSVLIASCVPSAPPQQSPTTSSGRCGDGICDGPENLEICPQDCPAPPAQAESPVPSPPDFPPPVLNFGIMVHLEGWQDDRNQAKYEQHVRLIREYADLFESYGAVLTLETKDVTRGTIRWGDNVLLEMEQRGHGVGVHADTGGKKSYNCNRFTAELREMKNELESLDVTVIHLSGNASHCDWVTASVEAGYAFTTGVVAYHTTSMPEEARPEEFKDCQNPADCHQPYPLDLAGRMHPWRANSGADWTTHDPNGKLVIIPSGGLLVCMDEERATSESLTSCEFTNKDVEAFTEQLEEALSYVQPGEVNTYYLAWSLGAALDQAILADLLASIQPYVASGQVKWMTLQEMYQAYLQWEGR